ncbi:unnamed protein product [Aureobasidium uvarum]|uniref:Uncharacterized protein n=1 Tax=Aureobasidium uvarum TaxID=2773716 RepID=A0A9N8PTD2_9PEZI|nr:unnamed protein product [Aureobasidium uvarum]
MTGIEVGNSCKDPAAETLVGKFGSRGDGQPKVGQRAVQEAMRRVQEGDSQTRIQRTLPQHQARFEGHTPIKFEALRTVNAGAVVSTSSLVTASDETQSTNTTLQQQQKLVSSTADTGPQGVVEDEDEDAEYEVEELQRCCSTDVPRRPPGPVQQRVSLEPST